MTGIVAVEMAGLEGALVACGVDRGDVADISLDRFARRRREIILFVPAAERRSCAVVEATNRSAPAAAMSRSGVRRPDFRLIVRCVTR